MDKGVPGDDEVPDAPPPGFRSVAPGASVLLISVIVLLVVLFCLIHSLRPREIDWRALGSVTGSGYKAIP